MYIHTKDRYAVEKWASNLLLRRDWVILDTETTGLDRNAEIVQIGILSSRGEVIVDTLVRPTKKIPPITTAIHGITDLMVETASSFTRLHPVLCQALRGKNVIIYNAVFDLRIISQTCQLHRINPINIERWECAMLKYAAYKGEKNQYGQGYRLQKLEGGDHTAIGDCRATLSLIKKMAGSWSS